MIMVRNKAEVFIFVLLTLFLSANALADDNKGQAVVLAEGDTAPPFELIDPAGAIVSFPAAGNRPSVILFWATWCPYCKALMPLLEDIRRDFSVDGVEVFALNVWENGDPVSRIKDGGFDFRLLLDADPVADAYGVRGTPGLFVVDGRGHIVYRRRPSGDRTASEIAVIWAEQTRAALKLAMAESGTQ